MTEKTDPETLDSIAEEGDGIYTIVFPFKTFIQMLKDHYKEDDPDDETCYEFIKTIEAIGFSSNNLKAQRYVAGPRSKETCVVIYGKQYPIVDDVVVKEDNK